MVTNKVNRIIICAGTGCVANGALKIYDRMVSILKEKNIQVALELKQEGTLVSKSGCQGFCQMGPLVTLMPDNILYVQVKTDDVEEIIEKTVIEGELVERLLYSDIKTGRKYVGHEDIPFYKKQKRFVLKKCGMIDPESLDEYISTGGYETSKKVLETMTPENLCKEMMASGLRGRGGGGFLTGKKWDLTRINKSDKKNIICNGDEGDPGAFMDRSVMEGNPHCVIEGMIIAAHAVGSDEGYVYVRAEYPLAVARMKKAVIDARQSGILGKSFDLHVMEGAGAFVCGEETALMSSIEGSRGMPKPKPPFPAQSGLWGKPTLINNVETFAAVPLILAMGVNDFKKMGTEASPGTKTFAITGHVLNTGLIEVPLGTTLREIVYDIAGGITDDEGNVMEDGFKAVQIGGPSGGCLTKEHMDLSMEFDSLKKVGAMVGSGGLVVMNNKTCMVSIARFFMQFTQNESCGKCVLCREGTKQMLNLLDDITEGRATSETIPLLEDLARAVQKGSLCGLGKTAPSPVLSTLRYFRDEYDAHVNHKYCPAGQCKALKKYKVIDELCRGCTLCAKKCPVNAISGAVKSPHVIDQSKCIKCGVCAQICKFGAIEGAK